ncbi:MAG: hypothetical protein KDE53_20280, partial [Caldilineaceae bacterium]|nr:hypothetical protein [Caldilineaceae bacterium]
GVLYLLAYAQVASRQQVIVSQSTDNGTTWREWSRVAPSLLAQRHISAATDRHGALHVVWQQESFSLRALLPKTPAPTPTEVHYARYDGTGWRDFIRIAPGEGGAQTFPSIQVSSHRKADQAEWEDTVWVAWSESNGENAPASGSTIYATLKAGDTWYPPRAVTAGGEQIYPSFARTPMRYATVAGTPYSLNAVDLVWLYNGPEQKQIYFAQLTETQYRDGGELLAARAAGLPSIQPGAVSAPSVYPMAISIQPHRWLLQWIWQWQLTREAQSLLFILLALAGYLFLKFAFSRWFATTMDQ